MRSIPILLLLFVVAMAVYAQEATPIPVSEDEVAAVASRMYCPVCENEPLDACYNTTCIQWKAEIHRQLSEGRSPDEIINFFVTSYGEHVVGVPQDAGLRLLSYFAPIVGFGLALLFAFLTFRRWQKQSPKTQNPIENALNGDESYRSRIEQDVS
jgi:cytochrome c-type biogenesis protein CcmH